jgi:hypothetical protein
LLLLLLFNHPSTEIITIICHYIIQRRIAGFAITLYYHPAGLDVVMVVYHLLCELLVFFSVCISVCSTLIKTLTIPLNDSDPYNGIVVSPNNTLNDYYYYYYYYEIIRRQR